MRGRARGERLPGLRRRLPTSRRSTTTAGLKCNDSGTNGSGGAVTNADGCRVLGRTARLLPMEGQKICCLLERPADEPAQDDRADGVELVLEAGGDAEVAATATQRPEHVGVGVLAADDLLAGGSHEIDGQEVVAREPEAPGEPPGSATEGEARDARGGDDAAGRREAVRLCSFEITPGDTACRAPSRSGSTLIPSSATGRSRVRRRTSLARGTVATTADRGEEAVSRAKSHRATTSAVRLIARSRPGACRSSRSRRAPLVVLGIVGR